MFRRAEVKCHISPHNNGNTYGNLIVELDKSEMSVDISYSGVVAFGKVAPYKDIRISIPFTTDLDLTELQVHPRRSR